MVYEMKAMRFPFLKRRSRTPFFWVSLLLASACTDVQVDRSETFSELDSPAVSKPEIVPTEEEGNAPAAATAISTDACSYLSGDILQADIEADDDGVEVDHDALPASSKVDPCHQLERTQAEQKLARLRAVSRQADLYTVAEALLAEMDRDADGVLSGNELNPNARIVQSYMSKQPSGPPQDGQPPRSVSTSVENKNISLFAPDLAVILMEYFEMSDKNANGVLDPDESEWLASTVYPDEAATLARLSEE